MKVEIYREKLEEVILTYLKNNFEPDYGWGLVNPEDKTPYKHYQIELDKYGSVTFLINDEYAYKYWDIHGNKYIEIFSEVSDILDGLFNEFWKPVFMRWFEENTGFEVDGILLSS